jgi:hypothetical protein
VLLAVVVAGLAIYQVIVSPKHTVDHTLIGALVVLALAFAGQVGDRVLDRVEEKWRRR